jgi:hypothetical protein
MDDEGVSEVIGYILSFALSAVFLMIALSSFWTARNNTDGVLAGSELKAIADRVAGRIVEAGLVGQEFQNATFNATVPLPKEINGHPFMVVATNATIYVNATDADFKATATTFNLQSLSGFYVWGTAYSSNERLLITYSLQPTSPTTKQIHIRSDQ